MAEKIVIDKAGRVVLPKRIRDKMRLSAGDALLLEHQDEQLTLRPARPQAALTKEQGVWVYQGERSEESIPDLIDVAREKRIREFHS